MVTNYINQISKEYKTKHATEHSYRGYLKELIEKLDENIIAINEPKRVKAGSPDYLIATKSENVEIGYIEAKDIGKNIKHKSYNEQFKRYKDGLENLIITDYMAFQFYKNGSLYTSISIAKLENNKIISLGENFKEFINLIKDFTSFVGQSITSDSKLAQMMAHKAKLMSDVIHKALEEDIKDENLTDIYGQYKTFQEMLIHDMSSKDFADMYAQTITYGMFTARYHDETLNTFSREEAAKLVPHSNPFLRSLFQQLAGYDLDTRIVWIVDSLVKIFRATNVKKILENFGNKTSRNDPIIHFYEDFIAHFNPKLRKARGIWYTPEPVVKFIVKAVDEVLKNEFELEDGLSDTSKIRKSIKENKEVHKVQVLDPATGTGTFLAEIIKYIKKDFYGGSWSKYVEDDLIPRLHGFEIIMASYAMAHLKLDLLLKLTEYVPQKRQRLKLFLTNSLETHHENTGNLFASFLATESREADRVKKDSPIMVLIGNPPYAVSSSNKSYWIQNLIKDYKKDLNERNIQPLSDDYIKFIRYGQHYIEKNGEGILAYISNNSFIDGIIHRQMRKSLLECFDKIYILDLHGNSKKKEVCPDGSKDENVFDIMQGVSINIFVKTKESSKKLGSVYHYDLQGKRDFKYEFLNKNSLKTIEWSKLECKEPNYFFVPKDFGAIIEYEKGFKVEELYLENNAGVVTARDKLIVQDTKEEVEVVINNFYNLSIEELRLKYDLHVDSRDWKVGYAKNNVENNYNFSNIKIHSYRPFDNKYIFYTKESKGFLSYPRYDIMKHMQDHNIGLNLVRQSKLKGLEALVSKSIPSKHLITGETYNFPLYLYPDENSLETKRTPNLNLDIVADIEKRLNLKFTPEKIQDLKTFAPIDILDYIYAVLHSPKYREKYKEFLKIDFPRVPYPDIKTFYDLVKFGKELRSLHLMKNKDLNQRVIEVNEGTNEIIRKIVKKDVQLIENKIKLHINDTQYISNIPLKAWEFYIGGYQPAQKWLKDRSGRELSHNDFKHYNKIINALVKTDEIMKKIDKVLKIF
ncbi:MAG: N-6 DNA methylase [Sulfurospirillum sp.]|nr:N-6 DNA methylase [Sulfurospirillum sp.]